MDDAIDELVARARVAADELATMDGGGALHIFVEDGNCDQDDLEFCLAQPNITERERDFVERMIAEFTDSQLYMVWSFAQIIQDGNVGNRPL